MNFVIITSLIICVSLMAVAFFKPSVKIKNKNISIYWLVPLAGAAVMIATGHADIKTVIAEFTSDTAVNPLKILILFLSMTLISIYLDNVDFFKYLASKVLHKAGHHQLKLFFYLYITVSVLTVFTSNDIIVLTFTPFICYFAKNAKIDPTPYLFAEFIAANTWSMFLIIGNPTNIYLATSGGIGFTDYIKTMALPTVASGAVSLLMLLLLFGKRLKAPITTEGKPEPLKDKKAVAIGLVHLLGCIALLVVSSYTSLPMWIISLGFFISLYLLSSIYLLASKKGLGVIKKSFAKAPWETIPFVLSMFIIVLALEQADLTAIAAKTLGGGHPVFNFGIASFTAANFINNIPMSVLFSAITKAVPPSEFHSALYASIIGSNLGAFLTPLGALAGIMWTSQLKSNGVRMGFSRFSKYGTATAIPALAAALITLSVVI